MKRMKAPLVVKGGKQARLAEKQGKNFIIVKLYVQKRTQSSLKVQIIRFSC